MKHLTPVLDGQRPAWTMSRTLFPRVWGCILFGLGTWIVGEEPGRCWRVGWRDGGKHPSPNSGIAEAAMAGALGVRLGGMNTYDGVKNMRPYLGDPLQPLESSCITEAVRVMYATSAAGLAVSLAWRWIVS